MRKETFLFLLLPLFCLVTSVQAQRPNRVYTEYINQYSGIAMQQMTAFRIPASIILAQGLLESGAGQSTLAVKANNHFGIKCGGDWKGRTVRKTDDAPNECFRAYSNARDSYMDHSRFLTGRPRYASLFQLDITDYKSWAHGLKKAGYATDPSYANRLITIIETYELYRFDSEGKKKVAKLHGSKKQKGQDPGSFAIHQVYLANDLAYVLARRGDTFESLSGEFKISARKLRNYNDLHKGYTLVDGDVIYLRAKRAKSKKYASYKVREGDSMHTISQVFGIKLKSLYRMNGLDPEEYVPQVGDLLRLR